MKNGLKALSLSYLDKPTHQFTLDLTLQYFKAYKAPKDSCFLPSLQFLLII